MLKTLINTNMWNILLVILELVKAGYRLAKQNDTEKIISSDDCYQKSISELRDSFLKRNYP